MLYQRRGGLFFSSRLSPPTSPPGPFPTPPGAPRQVGAKSSQLFPQSTSPPGRDRREEPVPETPFPPWFLQTEREPVPLGCAHSPGATGPRPRRPLPPRALPPPRHLPGTACSPIILSGSRRPASAPGLSPYPPGTAGPTGSRRYGTRRLLPAHLQPPQPGRRRAGLRGDPRRARPLRAPGGARRRRRPRGGAGPGTALLPRPAPGLSSLSPVRRLPARAPRPQGGLRGEVSARVGESRAEGPAGPRGGVSLRREGFDGHPKPADHKQGHPDLLGTGHSGGLGGQAGAGDPGVLHPD